MPVASAVPVALLLPLATSIRAAVILYDSHETIKALFDSNKRSELREAGMFTCSLLHCAAAWLWQHCDTMQGYNFAQF